MAGVRRLRAANRRTGCATSRSQTSGGIGAGVDSGQRTPVARKAAMMLPPDTDEIVSSFASTPVSLRRRSAPRWNSVARKPPPERHSAIPARSRLGR